MRQITAQEKYRAVKEGILTEGEFVRQMRLAFPQFLSPMSTYPDTVQILKNYDLINEGKEAKEAEELAKYSDDSLRRSIDIELEAMGLMSQETISGEDHAKAKLKAIKNLKKDPLHYYNLIAGESSKVDKNDRPKETKRGALEKDTFNDMKKATLKERKERLVEGTRALVGFLSGDRLTTTYNHYDGYPSNLGKGLEAHYNNDDAAKDIAMKGYITGMDPDTGEITQTHKDAPGKVILPDDAEQRAREIGEEIDKFGAEYGYIWDDESNKWITIKNTGIRSMIDQIMDKMAMVNVHSGETMEGVDEIDTSLDPYEDKKEIIKQVIQLIKSNMPADNETIKDFIRTHYDDIINLGDDEAILDEFQEFLSVNTDYVDETDAYDNDEETQDMIDKMRKDGKDADDFVDEKKLNEEGVEDANYKMGEAFKRYGIDLSRDVIVAEMDGGTPQYGGGKVDIEPAEPAMLVAKRLERHRLDTILDYESEGSNGDFPVMYEDGFYGDYTPEGTEHKLTYSEFEGTMWDIFQAPSGVSEKKGKDHDQEIISYIADTYIQNAKDGDRRFEGFLDLNIRDAVQDVVGILQDPKHPLHDDTKVEYGTVEKDKARGLFEKKGKDHDQEILSYIADTYIQNAKDGDKAYAEFRDLNINDAVQDVVGILQDPKHPLHIDTKVEYGIVEKDKARGLFEKKGKDHDGDGDVDGDDYKHAKDKAIKKAMSKDEVVRENLKAIITKVLEEDQINEAATKVLSAFGDDYAGFDGMKSAINALENIVTDIEQYYDKTRTKIQKVYDTLGEIRNEEGLKVGGFLAPAVEQAFNRDLRPVIKQGFTKGIDMPQVKKFAQPGMAQETEAPKQTVFGLNEKKK